MRRYTPLRATPGHKDPVTSYMRASVLARDKGCVGPRVGMPGPCAYALELDHIRASSMGKRSPSEPGNLVSLCSMHHRVKTEAGRKWRPLLLAWVARYETAEAL